jgi:hypothetical protein
MEGDRPSKLKFNQGNHTYYDGKKWIPSVTGITGRIEDKGGLLDWSAKCVATAAIEDAATLSRKRRLEGDDEAFTWLWHAANRERDGKGVNGSDLHDVADRMLSGREMPEYLDPNIKFMAENVAAFMVDYAVDAVHSEVRLCHRSLSYCGTTDQIGIVPQYGELPMIIDWKTSESMYRTPKFAHGKNAMQLTAYSHSEVMWWDDKSESDMLKLNDEVGLIVMIRPDGYKVYEYDLTRSWPQFERALDNYHWWRDVEALSRGPIRPAGLVDNIVSAAQSAESMDELLTLRDRAVHYEVWSEELRKVFTARKRDIELEVTS